MGKRKLTGQQKRRVTERQAQRISDADADDSQLGLEQEGLVIARHGATVEVDDENQQTHLCNIRQHIDDLVPGDKVLWRPASQQAGVVVACLPRQTVLTRPNFHGYPKPIAANVTQMLIVFAPKPEPSADIINKYLVAAELLHITPVIILNKMDLLSANSPLLEWIKIFNELGYQTFLTTQKDLTTLAPLQQQLKQQISILLGQSGVGKSSLASYFLPDTEEVRVSALSQATGFGKHTTSTARLYHLKNGGALIDSPGVRNFTLWQVTSQEVLQGFIECRPVIGQCKFSNCSHQHEPGCAILELFAQKKISSMRFNSLKQILTTNLLQLS